MVNVKTQNKRIFQEIKKTECRKNETENICFNRIEPKINNIRKSMVSHSINNNLNNFSDFYLSKRRIFVSISIIISILLLSLAFILRVWDFINLFFIILIFNVTLFQKPSYSKNMVAIFSIIYISVQGTYIIFNGVDWSEWYFMIDIFSHFTTGLIFYFLSSTLISNQNVLIKFSLAIVFEIIYELIELAFGYGYLGDPTAINAGFELVNLIPDISSNIIGSSVALFIEYFILIKNFK